jgi:RHS repeat-associated protein
MSAIGGNTLSWDKVGRLTTYQTDSNTYTAGTQRLIRNHAGARTLYLPAIEVAQADSGPATWTVFYAITGAIVAIRTGGTLARSGTMSWYCAHDQRSTTCTTPTNPGSPPSTVALKRYRPYGTDRTSGVATTASDHGFLGAPKESTGLTYLDARYLDPQAGIFTRVDPLVIRTRDPYGYGAQEPSSMVDPSGRCVQQTGSHVSDDLTPKPCHEGSSCGESCRGVGGGGVGGRTIVEIPVTPGSTITVDIDTSKVKKIVKWPWPATNKNRYPKGAKVCYETIPLPTELQCNDANGDDAPWGEKTLNAQLIYTIPMIVAVPAEVVPVGDEGDGETPSVPISDGELHGLLRAASRGVDVELVTRDGDLYIQDNQGNDVFFVKALSNGDGTSDIVIRNGSGEIQGTIASFSDATIAKHLTSGKWYGGDV